MFLQLRLFQCLPPYLPVLLSQMVLKLTASALVSSSHYLVLVRAGRGASKICLKSVYQSRAHPQYCVHTRLRGVLARICGAGRR